MTENITMILGSFPTSSIFLVSLKNLIETMIWVISMMTFITSSAHPSAMVAQDPEDAAAP